LTSSSLPAIQHQSSQRGREIGGHIEFIRHRIGGIIVVLAQLEDRPAGQGWS